MIHMFPVLHNSDDTSLPGRGWEEGWTDKKTKCRKNKIEKLNTSIWCFRSSSIRSRVPFLSSLSSTLEETVLILIFCIPLEKSWLKEKDSSGCTSRPGGCFFRILNFAQANDCSCRFSSVSSIVEASLISLIKLEN